MAAEVSRVSDRPRIRDVLVADLPALLALNENAVPHVNSLPLEELRRFVSEARYFRVAVRDGQPIGFLVAFVPGALYDSPNYRWFCANYTAFVYIDRVVIAPSQRGGGVGRALYLDVQRFAGPIAPLLACEVNIRPSNEASMRFHQRFGFEQVGRQETEGGAKQVSLMCKRL